LMGDALSDNIWTVAAQAGNRYSTQNLNTRNAHYGIWSNAYGAVNELNNIIAGIDNIPNMPASKAGLRARVKAEALALRAMIYFDIARVYGYEPNRVPTTGTNANFDKSAVLRLVPTKLASEAISKPRATILETYAVIEKDLTDAIATFKSGPTVDPAFAVKSTNPFRVTESFAHALLGKVYLYWGGKDGLAVQEFDKALNTTIASAVLSPAGNAAADFKKVPHPESLFELNYVQSVEVVGVTGSNDGLFTYTQPTTKNASNLATFGGQTVPNELIALFEPTDDRKALIFSSNTGTTSTVYNWANKYSGSNGAYTDNVKVMRYADVLLMKAEALANQSLYVDAAALVVQLRTARNASITGVPTTVAIIDYIQNERRRELFFEGHRWFDLKRLSRTITKPAQAPSAAAVLSTDYRILAPIPTGEISLNPALPQNPNY
ncbi:MAG: RagB/SusD family nutrient uptake outer membrane protein, partial [Pedobacter sp.]